MKTQNLNVNISVIGMWLIALSCVYSYSRLAAFLLLLSGGYVWGRKIAPRDDMFYETGLAFLYMWSWLLFGNFSCHAMLLLSSFLVYTAEFIYDMWNIESQHDHVIDRNKNVDFVHPTVLKKLRRVLLCSLNTYKVLENELAMLARVSSIIKEQQTGLTMLKNNITLLSADMEGKTKMITELSSRVYMNETELAGYELDMHSDTNQLSEICEILTDRCALLEREISIITGHAQAVK